MFLLTRRPAMMKAVLGLSMALVLVACSDSTSKPSYLFKPAVKEGVAAKTGELEISNAEIADGIESEIFEAESKLFEIKFNKLRAVLLQKLMDKDPRKQGLSNDEYLNKYIIKDVKISDKEIDKFIVDEHVPQEHINPQTREKIREILGVEAKKMAVDHWVSDQTKKNPVEVYIPKPRRSTFAVEAGNSPFSGDKDAKVTIIEFSDFQCPFCARGADIFKQVKKKYGNKVKIVFKNFPLPFHNHAEVAANAGLCANEQGVEKFWKLHDEMFAHQDSLDVEGLKNLGKKVGLEMKGFEKCLAENKYIAQVKADMDYGRSVKVKSTPTFFVNGQLVNGALPFAVFSDIIDEELAK